MENPIAQALEKLFQDHRIIFWYDAQQELREEYQALNLADVVKLEIENNAFALKYRLLREEPKQKFLLYRHGPAPEDKNNWLLDIQLSHKEFRTDQAALWREELGLGLGFSELMEQHGNFLQNASRRSALKRLLHPRDTIGRIRLKMLAVCAGSDPRVDNIVENLLAELGQKTDEKMKWVKRCQLAPFLWEQMERCYGYKSSEPGMRDFVIELFKSCYAMDLEGKVQLAQDASVFLKRWKDSRQHQKTFKTLSDECAEVLKVERDLETRKYDQLLEMDYFQLIDKKIIHGLVAAVAAREITRDEMTLLVRQRRQGHWYAEFSHLYEALDMAAHFMHALDQTESTITDMTHGVQQYSKCWHVLDRLYRKYICHVRMSGKPGLMDNLSQRMENLYSNNYLLALNDRWQVFVDKTEVWRVPGIPQQNEFFRRWVRPFLKKDVKICVIISDALRYEIGYELLDLIRRENRYNAELEPALSMLPSYTQMGMAALLPHETLTINTDGKTVLADGASTAGAVNREKILTGALSQRATVVGANKLAAMKGEDCRALVRENDVIYVYHNHIDNTGDKQSSEERAFDAAETTLTELVRLIKRLTAANINNLLVTADHGFIYQYRPIEASDYSVDAASGDEVLSRNRRFVLGHNLKESSGLRKFTSAQLGLEGEMQVLIPNSINRLRVKGSGSRFVHGGASLQEVVIPVLTINKKRQSDISRVEVDILRGASSLITSSQLTVVFYQVQPTSEKVKARELRAGIYTTDGEQISDRHSLTFDLTAESPRERELPARFILTRKADSLNGQEVVLKLEEKLFGTTHYQEYKTQQYRMQRSFTSDFDF